MPLQKFKIVSETNNKPPRLPWRQIKNKILGAKYSLVLVFCDDSFSRKLNRLYRDRNKPTNVLAFPYSKSSGEIFLNLDKTKIEAPSFDHNYKKHSAYLFIHALLHLKGFLHGSKMESEEKAALELLGY